MDDMAIIKPFVYDDPETGDRITISVSERYTTLSVNNREYYFIRETGDFDGTSTVRQKGPVLIYDVE